MSLFTDRDGDALLIIGMQDAVLARTAADDAVVATVAGLTDRARLAGVPVVWVQYHDDDLGADSPGWQLTGRLSRIQGEPLIEAAFADAFAGTRLHDELASAGAAHLVVAGARSDTGVRGTVTGGLYRGYDVTLVSDGHTTVDDSFDGTDLPAATVAQVVNKLTWTTHLPGVTAGLVTAADVVFGPATTEADLIAASEIDDEHDDERDIERDIERNH